MKKENGITLIALVITIIVLLILAGVTINLTLGQNGIFKTAEGAARNYKEAEEKELAELDKFDMKLEELQQQTTGNYKSLGTIVKTENGINYTADGAGNIIPVPEGFKPIAGTKDTGFVIKNDTDDNEFVWVPVEGMGYIYNRYGMLSSQPEDVLDITTKSMKIKASSTSDYYYTEGMPEDEEKSVAKYGGYYIGRYEAGIEGGKLTSTSNASSSKEWTGWTAEADKEIKLVVKPGVDVWNYITRNKAIEVATGLYNKVEDNVTSKLCSSYAWDTALRFIETQNSGYAINSTQGNYLDKADTLGRPAQTGKTQAVNNIYDMGGNLWEWTTESYSNETKIYTVRGGRFANSSSAAPASVRAGFNETHAVLDITLRITLFL